MEVISFARGIPAPACIPIEELADCARWVLERDGATVLSYGPVGGYQPLRDWLGKRHGVDPERILITNGSLQGMVFLAEHFAGRRVLVESPTYDRPLKILSARGVETVPLAMDDEGLELDGRIEPIGGVRQKTIGVKRAGVNIFLVPAGDNAREAARYGDGLRIIPVRNFQQALRALATLRPST